MAHGRLTLGNLRIFVQDSYELTNPPKRRNFALDSIVTHCLAAKLKHEKMGTLQFYIPGFQNNPNYPKQNESLKSTKGNLK